MLISDDHPVSSFMDQFFINLYQKRMIVSKNLRAIFQTHKQIWNNESYRKIVLETLIRIGTNMLLKDKSDMIWHVFTAQAIIAIEHYNGKVGIESVMNSRVVASKWRDLSLFSIGSRRRDALKFFRKRTSCKCLKKIHLEARKALPKVGQCMNCDKEMERVSLSVCSQCMVHQYCSRKCQIAAWPDHKRSCVEYVKHEQSQKYGKREGTEW